MHRIFTYPNLPDFAKISEEMKKARLLIIGEDHVQPSLLTLQLQALESLHNVNPNLVLALEMFNTEQQHLLDDFLDDHITLDILKQKYDTSSEGFPLEHYGKLLEKAKRLQIPVKGIIIPRVYATKVVRDGLDSLDDPESVFPSSLVMKGSKKHREYFEALVRQSAPMMSTGLSLDRFFLAQIVKDSSMAYSISQILLQNPEVWVVAIMGKGHMEYGYGVPERVKKNLGKKGITIEPITISVREKKEPLHPAGITENKIADYVISYEKQEESEQDP